jgi:hypothetical protein
MRENRGRASELKFTVTIDVAAQILEWARERMEPDPYASGDNDAYRITTIYLDTEEFDVYKRRGSYARSKYRVRRYGESNVVFLERKLRTEQVSKRRSVVDIGDISKLHDVEMHKGWPGHWFHRRIANRGLNPVCQISYLRSALVAPSDNGPIRLTVDSDITGIPNDKFHFDSGKKGVLLTTDYRVVELKFLREVPALFSMLLNDFQLQRSTHSKYRRVATLLGLAPDSVAAPQIELTPGIVHA